MRISSYNLNNLFERPVLFQLEGFSVESKEVLADIEKLQSLLAQPSYTGNTLSALQTLLEKYFLKEKNKYFTINMVREKLFTISKNKLTIKVGGAAEWNGFIELNKELVSHEAIQNTARVIKEVNADILCTVEVDDRPALKRFNEMFLDNLFPQTMVIDGNDDRGIDVGIFSKFPIGNMISHVHDTYKGKDKRDYTVFSRDCAEYEIQIDKDTKIFMLCNHFKSQGYGSVAANNAKRKKQSERVVEILSKYNLKKDYVAVAGDFNDHPKSAALKPLVSVPNLFSIIDKVEGDKGTYLYGSQTIDNIFVSKALFDKIKSAGIERRGIFHKTKPHFDTVTGPQNQASDHAAIWADFDL